jgi:hypothetical protein
MILRTVALLALFASQALAQVAPPQDLPAAIQRQVAARETLKTQAEEGQAALRKWYESSLDAIRIDAASKANLDMVLAVDAERGRMDRDLSAEESAALPKILRDIRIKYDQARLQRMTQFKAALTASLREYMITLDALEKSLTRKLDVEGAVAARKERAAAGDEISALSVPGAVAAFGPSTPGAVSPAAPVAPARSGPYVRPTAPGPIKVASELKAYSTIQQPGPGVIAFEMPKTPPTVGPAADGGLGVLLKNDPAAGRNGTTWSLTWTYNPMSFYGLTFIHPFRDGHIMVRLRSNRIEPVSPSGWDSQPLLAGGSPLFFKSEGASDIFPLQTNRKYAIVAQLDASGHYTVSIDGQVVRTADYSGRPGSSWSSATPITLPEGFKGEGLPMKWEAGYAGLFVWPTVQGALNLCEDISLQVGAPAPAQAAPAPAAPATAVVPPIVPPAAATPPVAVPGAPIAPATPVRATPAPVFATSLSPSTAGTAPVLQVASELKALGTIQNPAKDAIAFETPMGVGHTKGGRGVLIKNDPGVGKRGSTWSVEWTGSIGSYVYFVHPHNGGYAIVRVGSHGAEPVTTYSFQRQPMNAGGSSAIFKETPAAVDVYPLKSNQKYLLVSQFDPKGRYTLTVGGKVVQSGSFSQSETNGYTSATPLTLPEGFKGENLPMKWKAGYAALIVAPVYESSVSICENITFQGSAPLAEKAR